MTRFIILALLLAIGPVSSLRAGNDLSAFDGGQLFDEDPVSVSTALSVESAAAGKTYDAAVILDIADRWHINSAYPYEDFLIPASLSFATASGFTPHSIAYPRGHDVELAGSRMSLYDGQTIIPFRLSIAPDVAAGEYTVSITVGYQPCDDRQCGAPREIEKNLRVLVGDEGPPANSPIFAAAAGQDVATPATTSGSTLPAENRSDLQRLIDDYGFWGYFLALGLAFITGLLLSFSPCTYPMIPITVSVFAGQQRSVGRGFFLSSVYVFSMAVVYGIMGLVVSMVGGVFGAWLASPAVVAGIAIIFVIFSLSMFGLYDLNVPMALRQKLGSTKSGGGVIGSVVLGLVAALVVSPCVGPFVAGILLYVATSGSPFLGFMTLFTFAIGLGTLYLLIGTFSNAINKLPGSGEWMETVKKFFGFVLLLMAVYFLAPIVSPTITAILGGLLLLALGVFGGGLDRLTHESSMFARLKKFVGLLALILGIYLVGGTILQQGIILPPVNKWLPAGSDSGSGDKVELIDWNHDLESGLARALEQKKPVVIDTWATWCVNCRVLDRKVFGNDKVAEEIGRFVPIKVQLETADSDQSRAFMKRFSLKHYTLPTTLLINSDGEIQKVMQGVMSPDEMIAELKKVR